MTIPTCKQNLECNNFKINHILKSRDSPRPRPPKVESLPYPWEVVGFDFFPSKMREKDEPKGTWSNFNLACVFLSTGAETVRGRSTPFRELVLTVWVNCLHCEKRRVVYS